MGLQQEQKELGSGMKAENLCHSKTLLWILECPQVFPFQDVNDLCWSLLGLLAHLGVNCFKQITRSAHPKDQ